MANRPRCAHCGGNNMQAEMDTSLCMDCGQHTSWVGETAAVAPLPSYTVPSKHEALDAARVPSAEHVNIGLVELEAEGEVLAAEKASKPTRSK